MPDITDRSTLRETLEAITVEQIRPRAQYCRKDLPTRKAELIAVIVSTLASPEGVKRVWSQLDELSRKAIAAALENEGKFDEDAFLAQYGTTPWEPLKKKSPFLSLAYRDKYLPIDVFVYFGRIPPDVIPRLKPLAPPAEKFVLAGLDSLPEADVSTLLMAETEEPALHDLAATLSLIAEGKAGITPKTGRPAAAALDRLSERLLRGEYLPAEAGEKVVEPIRAFGWFVLVQAARLAKSGGQKLVLTPKGQKVLARPEAAYLRDAFEAWAHSNEFDELSRIRGLKGQKARGQQLTRPSARKAKIVAALGESPVAQWIPIEAFFRAIRAWRLNFEVEPYRSPGRLYVGSTWEYGYLSGFGAEASWRAVQAQYILACLWEYLATLGALDVAYLEPQDAEFDLGYISGVSDEPYFSPYVGLKYFRINRLGEYLLGRTDAYAGPTRLPSEPAFTVTPNLEVAITHRNQFTPNVRALLERLAEPASEGVYRLQREKILSALETGLTADAIADFLADKSAHALPQPVLVFLDDIRRNSRALKEAGPALLFDAADAALAQLLANDSVLRKLCSATGEATIVVPADKEAAFRRRIKQLGFGIQR